jgi:hypothetical protein
MNGACGAVKCGEVPFAHDQGPKPGNVWKQGNFAYSFRIDHYNAVWPTPPQTDFNFHQCEISHVFGFIILWADGYMRLPLVKQK